MTETKKNPVPAETTPQDDAIRKLVEQNLSEFQAYPRLRELSIQFKIDMSIVKKEWQRLQLEQLKGKVEEHEQAIAEAVIDSLGGIENFVNDGTDSRQYDGARFVIVSMAAIRHKISNLMRSNKDLCAQITDKKLNSIAGLVATTAYRPNHKWNPNQRLMNFSNCELELSDTLNIQMFEHRRDSFSTYLIDVEYDPERTAPRFDAFLDQVFAGDADRIQKKLIVGEFLGYCLVPSSAFQKYLVTVGSGANGKSVLNAVIRALLGSENCCSVSPADFSNRFYLELLRDKLANVVDEFAAGAIVSDEGLKKSCDGSPITSSQKYKNPTPFISYATGIYGTNHLPKATDTSHGFFRRAVVLPFNRRFNPPDPNVPDDPDRQDPNLIDALLSELPGILNFGIEGLCRLHQNNGFTHCPSSATAVSEWRSDLDPIPDFVGECCSLGPAKEVLSSVLYERYKHWSGNERSSEKLLSQRTFSQRIKNDWGVSNDQRDSAGKTKLTGIGLRDLFNH